MLSFKPAIPLSVFLAFLFSHPAAAGQDGNAIPEICRDAATEDLFKMLSYLPSQPEFEDADLEPVVCLGEMEDEDGDIFSELKRLDYQMEDEEILEEIADMKFDLGFQNQVETVFLSKTYGQTRMYILEMLKYPKFSSVGMAVNILQSYFIRGVITLSPEDEELFELLTEIARTGVSITLNNSR
jgi:hypothetical protein